MDPSDSIITLQQIKDRLLDFKAIDQFNVIDDTVNKDVSSFMEALEKTEGESISLIKGVAALRESLSKEIKVLEKVVEKGHDSRDVQLIDSNSLKMTSTTNH
jgi:hypothetical protein